MAKRFLLAVVVLFIAWSVLDFLIHGLILGSSYEATAQLWRPMDQMSMGLIYLVTIVGAAAFAGLYAVVVNPKSLATGLKYGLLFGIATGFPMGFGTYSVMPITLYIACVWFVAALVKATIGGAIVGAIIKSADS